VKNVESAVSFSNILTEASLFLLFLPLVIRGALRFTVLIVVRVVIRWLWRGAGRGFIAWVCWCREERKRE